MLKQPYKVQTSDLNVRVQFLRQTTEDTNGFPLEALQTPIATLWAKVSWANKLAAPSDTTGDVQKSVATLSYDITVRNEGLDITIIDFVRIGDDGPMMKITEIMSEDKWFITFKAQTAS